MDGRRGGPGRFAEPWLLILTSLADGPKHGYAIMADVAAFSGVSMEPGTLYGALSRLERRGWVRPLAAEERRRPYEVNIRHRKRDKLQAHVRYSGSFCHRSDLQVIRCLIRR